MPSRPHALLLTTVLSLLAACSGNPGPQALPPQTMAPIPPETGEPITNAAESLGSEVEAEAPVPTVETPFEVVEEPATTAGGGSNLEESDTLTLVLDAGVDEEEQSQSLFEASQAEKERRQDVGEATIVLTNKNLKEYSKGQLTFVEDDGTESDPPDETTDEPEAPGTEHDEDYWRNRVLDIRIEWRESLDRIGELESDIARLRRDFYAEDDGFYRDARIKPAWDQALIDLEEARRTAEESQQVLEDAVDEGRREGALPGWLREGIELEPTEEELEERLPQEDGRFHESSEPVIVEDQDDGGR